MVLVGWQNRQLREMGMRLEQEGFSSLVACSSLFVPEPAALKSTLTLGSPLKQQACREALQWPWMGRGFGERKGAVVRLRLSIVAYCTGLCGPLLALAGAQN